MFSFSFSLNAGVSHRVVVDCHKPHGDMIVGEEIVSQEASNAHALQGNSYEKKVNGFFVSMRAYNLPIKR